MLKHELIFGRPRLGSLINNVYIPKLKVKMIFSEIYQPETLENYNKYDTFIEKDKIFGDKDRSRDEVILGVESSFDDSCASLVNSFGEIKAQERIGMWDQWRSLDGVDPRVAAEKHAENLPIAVQKVLDDHKLTPGDKRLRAIAFTLGPGQESSLSVGINLA